MTLDDDLLPEDWRQAWRSSSAPPIRDAVARLSSRTRRERARLRGELALAALGTALLSWLAAAGLHPADRPFALAYAVVVGGFAFYTVYNARGTWRPRGEAPRDFALLERDRAQRRLRKARAGYVFLFLSTAAYVPWIWQRASGSRLASYAYLAVFVGVAAVFLAREQRQAARDEQAWQQAASDVGE